MKGKKKLKYIYYFNNLKLNKFLFKTLLSGMKRLCRFCLSFGVDWGNEKCPTIEQTPCWIEVQLPRLIFSLNIFYK